LGLLRTLLALSVVFTHTLGDILVSGKEAVQLFYIISGFLISYVLTEKKSYRTVKSFYLNRWLRVYPVYAIVASLTATAILAATLVGAYSSFVQTYKNAPPSAVVLLALSNVTVFLQDWIMFLGIEDGKIEFSENFRESEVKLYQGLLVPQAWTLGVELTFYAVAPFILKKFKTILVFLAASVILRIYLIHIDLGLKDPWNYRFFPTELAFFLVGSLAHRVLRPIYRDAFKSSQTELLSGLATYFLFTFILTFSLIPLNGDIKSAALLIAFVALTPFTFTFQSTRKWDSKIGDLSYPIYISHMLIVYILTFLLNNVAPRIAPSLGDMDIYQKNLLVGIGTAALSVLLAIVLNKFIEAPVESLRARLRGSAERSPADPEPWPSPAQASDLPESTAVILQK